MLACTAKIERAEAQINEAKALAKAWKPCRNKAECDERLKR